MYIFKGPYSNLIYLIGNQSDTIENETTHSVGDKIKLLEQVCHFKLLFSIQLNLFSYLKCIGFFSKLIFFTRVSMSE